MLELNLLDSPIFMVLKNKNSQDMSDNNSMTTIKTSIFCKNLEKKQKIWNDKNTKPKENNSHPPPRKNK